MKGKISNAARKILNDRNATDELLNFVTRRADAKPILIKLGDDSFEVSSSSTTAIDVQINNKK